MTKPFAVAAPLLLLAASLVAQNVTVTSPNGGESWALGSPHAITWSCQSAGAAKVSLILRDAGGVVGTIRSNVDLAAGSWMWASAGRLENGTVVAPGSDYIVRIRDAGNTFGDNSDGRFALTSPQPVIVRPLPDRVPPPPLLLGQPKLAVTAIRLVRDAGGFGIVFGYKNVGDGALPRRSQLTVKPDYRVLVDDREVDKGDLFIPENPPAGPGWELGTFSGGCIRFPVNEPHPWSIGDRITVILNERNVLNMGAASKTSALRLIALTAGYDLAFSGPAAVDWNASKARVTITKVGSTPQNSRSVILRYGIGYYHVNNAGGGGANEAVVYVPSGPCQETRSMEFPLTGPFPLHVDIPLDRTSPYHELEFHVRTDGRDQFDERNDDLAPARFERPGVPPGPRIQSVSFSPYADAQGGTKLKIVIALRNESGRAWSGLRLLMKRNDADAGEWQGFGLGAGAGSTITHYGPPAGYHHYFNFYLFDSGNHLIDSRQEIYY